MQQRRRRTVASICFLVVIAGSAAYTVWSRHQTEVTTASQHAAIAASEAKSDTALHALSTLAIKGRAPKTGYTRAQFSDGWQDLGHCNVRDYILGRDLVDVQLKSATDCAVVSGVLHDPYTGKTIQFVRGPTTSSKVQIDHVVAISDAWQKGAQQLSKDERYKLANDPLELLAVDGPTNNNKSDGDAATWLPPNKAYRCQYVARQIAVKQAYRLWITQAEHDAMTSVLATCSDQKLPVATNLNLANNKSMN